MDARTQNLNRQRRFTNRMHAKGFKKMAVWVHAEDMERFKAFCETLVKYSNVEDDRT